MRQVFFHELRQRRKGLVIWCLSIAAFMVLALAKFDTLATGGAETQKLLGQFPQTIQAVFGMSNLDILTVSGYFGVCFLYVALLVAVQAGLLGVGVLAEEEQDKTSEFLYVKPLSRERIIAAKLGAGLLNVVIFWLVTAVSTWLAVAAFASTAGFWHGFYLLMLAALVMQLAFFFIGSAAAATIKNSRAPGRVVAIAVFASYMLYVLAKFSGALAWLGTFSVFRAFDAADILASLSLNGWNVLTWLLVAVIGLLLTFRNYRRRDLGV